MMKTSILICATCLLVTGCSAQFRLPSLSSALSSLTGLGASSSNSNGGQSGGGSGQSSGSASSQYSGLVRDYGRNLMMAMSNIYPTLFKPPQSQAQQPQQPQQQQGQALPFESFGASQTQGLFGQSGGGGGGPSFTLGGSTFSISPSFPFGSLGGASQQQQQPPPQQQAFPQGPPSVGSASAHSPFSASFGSSINSPSSFGPLSSNPFQMSQSMPSFAPPSSYSAAFEAANGGGSPQVGAGSASLFGSMNNQPGAGGHSFGSIPSAGQLQAQASNQFGASSLPAGFGSSQHDPTTAQILGQPSHHQPQSISPQQMGAGPSSHSAGPYGGQSQQVGPQQQQQQQPSAASAQFAGAGSQQFRPEMMSIAASAPVPSSSSYSSYSNYGGVPAQPQHQQAGQQQAASSYQQPSYR